jgi:hypothetical protein
MCSHALLVLCHTSLISALLRGACLLPSCITSSRVACTALTRLRRVLPVHHPGLLSYTWFTRCSFSCLRACYLWHHSTPCSTSCGRHERQLQRCTSCICGIKGAVRARGSAVHRCSGDAVRCGLLLFGLNTKVTTAAGAHLFPTLPTHRRFWNIKHPGAVIFDESHFGKFTAHYLRGSYVFDIHPPLGKMTFAFFAWLTGYDQAACDYQNIGTVYDPNNCMYYVLRSVSATYGSLVRASNLEPCTTLLRLACWVTRLCPCSTVSALGVLHRSKARMYQQRSGSRCQPGHL